MGKEIKNGGIKYLGPAPNKTTGEPATLQPGDVHKNLRYMSTDPSTNSKYPNSVNHTFLLGNDTIVFNGSGHLNSLIKKIQPGDTVDITYVGQIPCPFGKFKGDLSFEYKMFYSDVGTDTVTTAPTAEADVTEDDGF